MILCHDFKLYVHYVYIYIYIYVMQNKLAAKHIRLDVCTLIKTDTDAPMFDKHGLMRKYSWESR